MKESWPCITSRWWMLFWWTQGWKLSQVIWGTYRTRYATENMSCLPPTWSFICKVRQSQRCLPENHITPVITWGSNSKSCICQTFTSFCSFNILDSLVGRFQAFFLVYLLVLLYLLISFTFLCCLLCTELQPACPYLSWNFYTFSKPFWESRKVKPNFFFQSWSVKAKLSIEDLFLISLQIIKWDLLPEVFLFLCLFAKAAAMCH